MSKQAIYCVHRVVRGDNPDELDATTNFLCYSNRKDAVLSARECNRHYTAGRKYYFKTGQMVMMK
jgi:hypothetical protein